MFENVAISLPAQVEIGMMSEIDDRGLVSRCRIVDSQFISVGQYVNNLDGQVSGIAFFAILAQVSQFQRNADAGFKRPRPLKSGIGVALELTYLSKDGEEGYPGNLSVKVVYVLTDTNELRIYYSATTDKPTIVNLTHHSYFNLGGQGNGDILKHQLFINANQFTPTDAGSIPTGELRKVVGTPFDFTRATAIETRIDQDDEQLKFGRGYDHNFVLNKNGKSLTLAARAFEPTSGRVMEVFTTEPGLQFYTGNFLDGTITG